MCRERECSRIFGVILTLATTFTVTKALEILDIQGPNVVRNGSVSLLVLDCEYDLSEYDRDGLVVKWYFNDQPFPSYQWIPNNQPQELGVLKGRLDLNHVASEDESMRHRALAILNPTTELSGDYTCWISSFENEDFKRKKLIIYAPARNMSMTYTKRTPTSVTVSCQAGGLFPEPKIAMYRSTGSSDRRIVEGTNAHTLWIPDEKYFNISIQMEMYDYELQGETVFICHVRIPGTEYEMQEEIFYYPGPPTTTTTTTTTTSTTTTSSPTITSTESVYVIVEDYDEYSPSTVDSGHSNLTYEEEIEELQYADNLNESEAAIPHISESVSGGSDFWSQFHLSALAMALLYNIWSYLLHANY